MKKETKDTLQGLLSLLIILGPPFILAGCIFGFGDVLAWIAIVLYYIFAYTTGIVIFVFLFLCVWNPFKRK